MSKTLLRLVFCLALLPAGAWAQAKKAPAKPPVKAAPSAKATTPTKPSAPAPVPAKTASPAAVTANATPIKAAGDSITGSAPVGVTLSPDTPAASPTALKVKAEVNPVTRQLSVRTDAPGPMRIEVNDVGGHPMLTRNVLAGNKPVELNVTQLAAGTYVVRCTAGERTGMRLVRLGL